MLRLLRVDSLVHRIPLVRPFKFGVAELTSLDHLVLRARFNVGGVEIDGFAGENLAPRWFTKNLSLSIADDVRALRESAGAAARIALSLPPRRHAFDFWATLRHETDQAMAGVPALVRQLGVSLIERCTIDATCRAAGRPLHQMLRAGLGVPPEALTALPPEPLPSIDVRHTVGLSDELGELPSILSATGITRLKIKLGGDMDADVHRLQAIDAACGGRIGRITLDGNENYPDAAALRTLLRELRDSAGLGAVRGRIAWIEQAVHRSAALGDAMAPVLREFSQFPQVIDESDADADALPKALACSYAGTTHKNCKGVFKSVLARARLAQFEAETGRRAVFSAEDLTIVAPWSQTQDLAAAGAVGVIDIERNGHHYADGLAAFPAVVGESALAEHPALYERDDRGIVRVKIRAGRLDLTTVNAALFGSSTPPSLDGFEPV